jgi:hypothetical protein
LGFAIFPLRSFCTPGTIMVMIATKPKPAAHHPAMWDWYSLITRNDDAERPNVINDATNNELSFNLQFL